MKDLATFPMLRTLALALGAISCLGPCAEVVAAGGGAAAPARAELRHVAIDLRFDWPARQAHGSALLTLEPQTSTDRIALDAGHLKIEAVTLGADSRGKPLTFTYDGGDKDLGLIVALDRIYRPKEKIALRIAYRTAWINQSDPANLWGSSGKGLRFFGPTTTDARKRRQIWTSGEPGSARYWFPSVDAPDARASTELRLTVEPPLVALASGTLAGVKAQADGTRTFHWRMDRPTAAHRTAFVIGEFVNAPEHQQGGVKLENWGYPDEREGTAASVPRLPETLRFFSELTGSRFPYPAYRQVFVQDWPWGHAAAMLGIQTENMVDDAGTHADFLYLWNGLQSETLAQQWFGNHLAPRGWAHLWLERGLGHHLAGLFSEHKNGRDEFLLWYLRPGHQTTLGDWAGGTRLPIVNERYADTPGFLSGNHPYFRAAAVLHMLRKQLGDEAWRKVLQHFAKQHGGKLVDTEDFRRSVEAVAGRPMQRFFAQWFYGVGHPVFEVSKRWDAAARRLELTVKQVQERDPKLTAFAQVDFFEGPVDIDIDGRIERVWLEAKALNTFSFAAAQEPKLVHFDHEGTWIKELRFAKSSDELLHQLRHTSDALGRQWAMDGLVARVKKGTGDAASANDALQPQVLAAIGEVAANRQLYWRVRFNALQALRGLVAPGLSITPTAITSPKEPALLDDTTRARLLRIAGEEGAWLRSAALGILGLTREAPYADLYLSHLRDRSDRVINAAATALGRIGSAAAPSKVFDALAALPAHPSWKNQSLISALDGLRELGDPRGADIALAALADVRSARWTLSTPVWDYRLAAAHTLARLGAGERGAPIVLKHLDAARAENDVNDIFSNLLLLVVLGDARALPAFAQLQERFKGDAAALDVLKGYREQLEAHMKASAVPSR
jgi:aminopeptidase N